MKITAMFLAANFCLPCVAMNVQGAMDMMKRNEQAQREQQQRHAQEMRALENRQRQEQNKKNSDAQMKYLMEQQRNKR